VPLPEAKPASEFSPPLLYQSLIIRIRFDPSSGVFFRGENSYKANVRLLDGKPEYMAGGTNIPTR
jgi:hypothetical protein